MEAGDWVEALRLGLEAVMKYGGARPGDRTMIDALHPALEALEAGNLDTDLVLTLARAVEAGRSGAERTKRMKAQAGRASYVAAEKVTGEDPGALAAAAWFASIGKVLAP